MISARILLDSVNAVTGDRLTTFLCVFPRIILAEINTHRVFSRNSASSRAIPIAKMIAAIRDNPAMPVEWGRNKSGMQSEQPLSYADELQARVIWLEAAESACQFSERLAATGVHKQIANRVTEPFSHMTTLITATDYQNFFALRSHEDADPTIAALSDAMLFAYTASTPTPLQPGEWHLPFGEKMPADVDFETALKIATARSGRTSYVSFDKEFTVADDSAMHDGLISAGHWSPTEHLAKALATSAPSGNFVGWGQYRKEFPDENRRTDVNDLAMERMERKARKDTEATQRRIDWERETAQVGG